MNAERPRFLEQLTFLYGSEEAQSVYPRLMEKLDRFVTEYPEHHARDAKNRWNEHDAILITYADIVQDKDILPLGSLHRFLRRHLTGAISTVHLLPFFPYSSDDGFSVIDYRAVDDQLGSWQDITRIGDDFRLMLDAVINHISSKSSWFKGFLEDRAPYNDYFIVVPEGTDMSGVFRPRDLPVLTQVETASGHISVWTTFSADQIDLDFSNSEVLLEIIDILLYYITKGAEFIRLDAIAYLWKRIETSSIHLPQTHCLVQLIRYVLDYTAPGVALITETNVPHDDNISYFGDGFNEAQLVYNFSLPPLVLHAFHTGSAAALSSWADSLTTPSVETTFFNFLASHDGIGLLPAMDILGESETDSLVSRMEQRGGFVSYRNNPDGTKSPYELNMNYLDALSATGFPGEDVRTTARRFLSSQAIMLSLAGVPGIYFHSLVGSRGWREGVRLSGKPRRINREKLTKEKLELELSNVDTLRYGVFQGYLRLLRSRAGCLAFHPNGKQQIVHSDNSTFIVIRTSPVDGSRAICLHNVSDSFLEITLDLRSFGIDGAGAFRDMLTNKEHYQIDRSTLNLSIRPYDYLWLTSL